MSCKIRGPNTAKKNPGKEKQQKQNFTVSQLVHIAHTVYNIQCKKMKTKTITVRNGSKTKSTSAPGFNYLMYISYLNKQCVLEKAVKWSLPGWHVDR